LSVWVDKFVYWSIVQSIAREQPASKEFSCKHTEKIKSKYFVPNSPKF
jgi:hypothetical protein